jgi:hypothetical protein
MVYSLCICVDKKIRGICGIRGCRILFLFLFPRDLRDPRGENSISRLSFLSKKIHGIRFLFVPLVLSPVEGFVVKNNLR